MTQTANSIEDLTLTINQEIRVNASLEVTFEALLEQMGPGNETHDGTPLPMKIEPWPGGRWYRDLGDTMVTSGAMFKPLSGDFAGNHRPLFASYPFVSNLQYRLKETEGATLISFRHTALGFIQDDHRGGVGKGWAWILERTRKPPRNPEF